MQSLNIVLRDELDAEFREAKKLLREGHVQAGVKRSEAAWAKVPPPQFDWDVSQGYAHAIATAYRDAQRYADAVSIMEALFASGTVLDYEDRPRFVLGTIYYHMGDIENAKRWLSEANRISKGRCFRGEDEKYRLLIAKK
jgi:tetratricopeptide (TPR) repeat protein